MSYQVLARKYRPQSFEEISGQQHVLQGLINALKNNTLHHAYIFTGDRGVGKTSLARLFAKAISCILGISDKPCNKCMNCIAIKNGNFTDFIEIDAASRTKVEDTREILDNIQYMPSQGKFKIYLIDEIHMLSNHSFNALLKTLEEPPKHVKFLLATTEYQKIPLTIVSRCLQFHLKLLTVDEIIRHIQKILKKENIIYDHTCLTLIAKNAAGSIRDALTLIDQITTFNNKKITIANIESILGTVNIEIIDAILIYIIQSKK